MSEPTPYGPGQQWPDRSQSSQPMQQPNYPQPGSYAPPNYAQPAGYPQGGYPQQRYPVPPKPNFRKFLWIGLAAGAAAFVLLLCAGAVVLARSFMNEKPTPPLVEPSRPPLSRAPSKTPRLAKLVTPDKVGSRAKLTDAEHTKLVAEAEAKLKESFPGFAYVVAYYGTADPKVDKLRIHGTNSVRGTLSRRVFDDQFLALGKQFNGVNTTNIVQIDPGSFGGFVSCGQTASKEGMPSAVCAWTGPGTGTYIIVQWYNRTLSDAIKKEILTVRGLVEVA